MVAIVGEASHDVIASFMQRVIVQYQDYGDIFRRSEPREHVAVPARIQPLDDAYQPVGAPVQCVTRDISCGGMGIFHIEAIESKFIEVCLTAPDTGEEMRILASIEHCTPCGAFYLIGCRFADVAAL